MARPIRVEYANARELIKYIHLNPVRPRNKRKPIPADYGYRDGSGVHRVVQRLDERAKVDAALARRLKGLAEQVSSVKG